VLLADQPGEPGSVESLAQRRPEPRNYEADLLSLQGAHGLLDGNPNVTG
jgi:hypothetical protein